MKQSRALATGLGLLAVMSFVLAATPPAAAQQEQALRLQPKDPVIDASVLNDGRLPPETAQLKVTFSFDVSFPAGVGVCPFQPVTVTFTPVNKVSYATASLSVGAVTKSTGQTTNPQDETIENFNTVMTVITTRFAPAFKSDEFAVKAIAAPGAQVSGGCNLKASPEVPVTFNVKHDYIPILEYAPAKYIQKTGQNKEVVFTVKMSNFGNGQTKVATTTAASGGNKLDALAPPSQTTLESKAEAGEKAQFSRDVFITGRTPHSNGYTNSLYSFTATFDATSAVGTGEGIGKDSQTITLSVQVQGVYVPGFDPSAAIGALGVAVLMIGMARRRL